MFRLTSFLERRPALGHDEFIEYWWREHSPLAESLPGLRKYTTTRPLHPSEASYDGVAELYFDDCAAFNAVLGPDAETDAMNDVSNFIERTSRFHLRETIHVDRERGERPETDSETPLTERTDLPVASFAAFRRRDTVDTTTFENAIADTVERVRADPTVRWFSTAKPTDDADADLVLKRTTDPADAPRSPSESFAAMKAVADVTHEFSGYERTVVDDIDQSNG